MHHICGVFKRHTHLKKFLNYKFYSFRPVVVFGNWELVILSNWVSPGHESSDFGPFRCCLDCPVVPDLHFLASVICLVSPCPFSVLIFFIAVSGFFAVLFCLFISPAGMGRVGAGRALLARPLPPHPCILLGRPGQPHSFCLPRVTLIFHGSHS